MRQVCNINDIIGKKIIYVVGHKKRKNTRYIPAEYLLFNDGETYIELEEQDYSSYHDCSTSAKELNIYKDRITWETLLNGPAFGATTEDWL